MFASIFILLHVAHLLADFPLQTDHQAAHKADTGQAGWLACLTHAATHVAVSMTGLAVGVVVLDLEVGMPAAAAALAWVGISHAVIDRRRIVLAWMRATGQARFAERGGHTHVDQAAHVAALTVAALAITAWS